MKKYFPIVLFIMSFTGFLCGQVAFDLFDQAKREKMVHPKVAKKYEKIFSDITLKTTENQKINLNEVSAPVVIINFWASWCTSCLEEIPSIVDLRSSFKESDIFILGINSDEDNYLREIEKISKKFNMNFPTVADPTGEVSNRFNVSSIPLTIIFHQGKVLEIIRGPRDFSSIESRQNLKELLRQSKRLVKAE